MLSTTLFPGRYVQGYDALQFLGNEIKRFGQKGLLIVDPFVADNLFASFQSSIEHEVKYHLERFGGESSDEEIERIGGVVQNVNAEVVVGIGGGKTLDTAKAVGYYNKLPVIIVPTLASTDAPTSALSVIYTPQGEFKRYLFLPKNPDVVLVDTKLVANSPARFLVSGMGDALATWFEAESTRQKFAGNMSGNLGSMAAYALARLCYDTLMEYGLQAKTSCEVHAVTPALERVVEANTLLSGLGFESGGLAAAHAIHNGFTVLEETHHYYHGEKVAFGTLTSLFLTGKSSEIIDKVYTFCEDVGLPTTLQGIGLTVVNDEKLMEVARAATAEGETIHNEPTPVTPEMVVAAIKVADAEGRRRQALFEDEVISSL
ncbi:MAG: glycerol dehydrogenase [Chloroflexi bacterium]|nr:glycerol dehydrogenase [Chloroflexota bacterium]